MKPVVSGYRLVREVARRDEDSVWTAVDDETGRDVALTIAHAKLSVSLEEFDRYLFALVSASTHPHLLTVHGGGITDEDQPFIVTEDCAPAPQRDPRSAPMETRAVLSLIIQLAAGVQHLHHASVIHGAISRDDLCITKHGDIVLGGYSVRSLIQPNEPPDAAAPRTGADARSDVRALGALMWELGDPSHFSVQVQTILAQAVAQPPKARPLSVAQLIAGLQRAEESQGFAVTAAATPTGAFTELAGPRDATAHLDAVTQFRVIDPDTVTRVRAQAASDDESWRAAALDAETRLRVPSAPASSPPRSMPLPTDPVSEARGVHAFDPGQEHLPDALYKPRATPAPYAPSTTAVSPPEPEPVATPPTRRIRPRQAMLTVVLGGALVMTASVWAILTLLSRA